MAAARCRTPSPADTAAALRRPRHARAEFYERLKPHGLAPLWEVLAALVTPTPRTPVATAKWSLSTIEPLLMEAGRLITAAGGGAAGAHPGESGARGPLADHQHARTPACSSSCRARWRRRTATRRTRCASSCRGAAPSPRSTASARRMDKYDLVLTPSWVWHDHGNETTEPMIWLDGLDIPLIQSLDASFAEHRDDRGAVPTSRPAGDAGVRWGNNLRPARTERGAGGRTAQPAVHLSVWTVAGYAGSDEEERGAAPARRPRDGVRQSARRRLGDGDHRGVRPAGPGGLLHPARCARATG